MTRLTLMRSVCAALLSVVAAASTSFAQECAATPLLGGRASAGLSVGHASQESAGAASVTAAVGARLRVSGTYRATRLEDVDRLRHEGDVQATLPMSWHAFALCPAAGASAARLSTDRSGVAGRVTTRDGWIGAEVSRSVSLPHALALTPFVQPMLVRRAVSWRSSQGGWIVDDHESRTSGQTWLGVSLATRRNAAIARLRSASGGAPSEMEIGVVTRLGGR